MNKNNVFYVQYLIFCNCYLLTYPNLTNFFFQYRGTSLQQGSTVLYLSKSSQTNNLNYFWATTSLEMRRELEQKCILQFILSGIVSGDAPLSYWPIFSLSLVTVPVPLQKLTWPSFLLKVVNTMDQFRFLRNYPPTPPLSQHFALSEK